ncbi:MAG: hypothetical protein OEY41_02325 [Acidimicrobiia bacterium]|nr:hypothetical protein [Acidimicrobiia bacterium]
MFFNVGGYEILVIAVLALIFIGPEQLREEFMSGLDEMPELKELTNLDNWTGKTDAWLGNGTDADPIVPRGFAERERQREAAALDAGQPIVERPVERTAPDPLPDGGLNQGAGAAAELVSPADGALTAPDAESAAGAVPPASEPAPFQPRSGAAEWDRPAPAADEGTGA